MCLSLLFFTKKNQKKKIALLLKIKEKSEINMPSLLLSKLLLICAFVKENHFLKKKPCLAEGNAVINL